MKKLYVLCMTLISLGAFAQITEVADINPSGDSDLDEFYVSNGILYFEADNGTSGNEPYSYDGTTVTIIKDINTTTFASGSSNPGLFIEFNDLIYFKASDGDEDDGNNETELWQTDGTEAGTTLVADINENAGGNPQDFFVYNNELYFEINDGSTVQVWRLNNGSPEKVTNNRSGGFATMSNPVVTPTGVFFRMFGDNGNQRPHFFDGTGDALELADIVVGAADGYFYNGNVYFEGDDSLGAGDELWRTDGTVAGTLAVADILSGSGDSDPKEFVEFNGELYFAAEDDNGYNLWKTDGTTAGTVLVINPNAAGDSDVDNLFTDGTNLYFSASDGTIGVELYKFDGTDVTLVKDINASGDSNPFGFTILDGKIFFTADNGTGEKLWVTDGTTEGTQSVATNVGSGDDPTDVDDLIILGARLIFSGTGVNGNELFSFDPSTLSVSETTLLDSSISVYPNPASSVLNIKSSSESDLNFMINDINGRELQNGTLQNNQIQIDLSSGLYILQLEDQNQTRISKKFIVE